MRHRNKINSLGRKAAHRKKTMSSLATALIMNKRINTTLAKAKALRTYVEPLITRSKEDSTHSRRIVFAHLRNKYAVSELFREISQKVADRPGGYTRILKTGFRKGDSAEMCFIELVDYNTHMLRSEDETRQKRTRRGRRRSKQADEQVTESFTETTPADQPIIEEAEADLTADAVAPDTNETVSESKVEPNSETEQQEVVDNVAADQVSEKPQPTVSDEIESTATDDKKQVPDQDDAPQEPSDETSTDDDEKKD